MTVRQVAVDFPTSREVFRSHGESGQPTAKFGHLEPLTHFACRRGIVLDKLLNELAAATGAPIDVRNWYAERVHHEFLFSALLLTVTLGAGWGVWLLLGVSTASNFGAIPAAHVMAHGEAQLWGFIVLFIMGISLRTVLQAAARHRFGAWVCRSLLGLALAGIGGSFLWFMLPQSLAPLGLASAGCLCLMSAGYWLLQIVILHTKWFATWARAVLASGLWLVAWAIVTTCLRWQAGTAGPNAYSNSQRMLLIELAVFGFAMNSIYGFGQMLLPGLLRIGSTRIWAIEASHWVHNMGAIIVILGAGWEWSGRITNVGCALLVAGAVLFAVGNRGFVGRRRTSKREELGPAPLDLYAPLAFFWLVTSLLLMTGGLLFEAAANHPLPHAYMGAVRHALTVGFMTTLILGVGQRLLPVLDRTVLAMPRLVLPIFILIGMGNLLRVGSELAILATPAAFFVMPFSGVLEWFAIVLFAVGAVATMVHVDPLLKRGYVSKRSSIAVLLAEYPWIEDRLLSGGTGYLQRARSVPHELTIGTFAEHEGYDAGQFVSQINGWLEEKHSNPSCGQWKRKSPVYGAKA